MTLQRPPSDTAPRPVDADPWRRAISGAPEASLGFSPRASLVVIAAHPDDEAIGVGRLLADHDGPIRCVTLTAGEGCHGPDADADEVAHTRLSEWAAALATLGAEPVETVRWPDGSLAHAEAEATELIAALVDATGADAVLAPWRHDPHPDHRAAGRAAVAASRRARRPLWPYAVWTPYWLEPVDLERLDAELFTHTTSDHARGRWLDAIDCHRSQIIPRPPAEEPVAPAALLERHAVQFFIRDAGDADARNA